SPYQPVKAPSTDAVDIDACSNVLIKNCYMSVNDDAVALKGGKGPEADKDANNGGNRNIIIEDCIYGFCHSALTCGSESIHNRNILFRRCTVNQAQRILWLKMRPDTPQNYEYISVEDITGNANTFIDINPWTQFFDLKGHDAPILSYASHIIMRNIKVDCNTVFNVKKSDQYILSDFTFENLDITVSKNPQIHTGFIDNFRLSNVKINSEIIDKRDDARKVSPLISEKLNRGLIAVKTGDGVYLSWRLLGTENPDVLFNIYKNGVLLNTQPLSGATCYLDETGSGSDNYIVKTLSGQIEPVSDAVVPWEKPCKVIQMNRPEAPKVENFRTFRPISYLPNDCSAGDLDGDGEYEIIVKWNARSRDNSHNGLTDNVFLDAYKMNGAQLWRIDLGKNIRAGAHYTQFMVYDLDGDGCAEIACKTAPGTIDGQGKFVILGNDDPAADFRNENGHILDGSEYLTVFDGKTGGEITTIPYNPPRGNDLKSIWGDDKGNRSERYLACIACLDGKRPSLVMCRGYYARTVLAAYDFEDGKLKERWVYDSGTERDTKNTAFGQGNHSIAVADVDGDGCDEIIYGGAAIDNDGVLLYSTGLGHGDAHHLSDLDPDRPGLEFFDVHENSPCPAGVELRDARTGQLLFGRPTTFDVGRGLAADIDSRYRGFEFWSAASDSVYNIKGEVISTRKPSVNFRIYWDGDLQDELLDGTKITKWNGDGTDLLINFSTLGAASINGSKNNPCLSADLFGDWREEAVYFDREDPSRLMIFTTVIPTGHRLPTLMHDPVYRLSVAWQNVGYNQPPHLGFFTYR
ncbi:MAG: hypothetical protein LBS08_06295, partial [Candidatus Symbiothrix sp.]|nr:hypothetical protein [Candidatus Symbiothrix sp.]